VAAVVVGVAGAGEELQPRMITLTRIMTRIRKSRNGFMIHLRVTALE
jgi:hypothetical protein